MSVRDYELWCDQLVEKTDRRVGDGRPELVTRFWGRAERRARKLNARRLVPFYRYEIVRENGRWAVVAMQNVAAPGLDQYGSR